ncbi:MAG: hypothetical protein JO315_02070 [Acidobacteria bacterium]|nr:hypothetical protein [Acidobacteriota bacterium]
MSLAACVVLAAACASGPKRPANVAAPALDVRMAHNLFFGTSTSTPATVDVLLHNNADVPITIRRASVTSPGMGQYGILTTTHDFHEIVPPGGTGRVSLYATAVRSVDDPTEPLTLRATVELEAAGARWREIITSRR